MSGARKLTAAPDSTASTRSWASAVEIGVRGRRSQSLDHGGNDATSGETNASCCAQQVLDTPLGRLADVSGLG